LEKKGNRTLYFDNDYATEMVKKRKEYNGMKKALREMGIHFQTPYRNIWIHWDMRTRTYVGALEAQRELRRRGFPMEELENTEGNTAPGTSGFSIDGKHLE